MEDGHYRRYAFIDIWNAARTERNFNYSFWMHILLDLIVETSVRNGGYFLVACACALITMISAFGFFVVIPNIAEPWSLWFVFNDVWGLYMLLNISFNYYMAVTTKPGRPCDEVESIFPDSHPAENERMCKKCNFVKPGRTHHCSVCKSCVMKMDHHCPWLSNCVGYNNYRYFVCFLIWVTITTSYLAVVCTPTVFRPGSVLFPDYDVPVSEAIYKSLQWPSFSLPSISTFIHSESEAVSREAAGRKGTIDIHKMLIGGAGDSGVRQLAAQSYVDTITDAWSALIDNSHRQLTRKASHHAHHHEVGATHTHLKSSSFSYKLAHWRDFYLPDNDFLMFFTFMLSMGVTCGTGILMWFHLFLISQGMSTLEYFESQVVKGRLTREGRTYVNHYDRGGLLRNFQHVFGEVPWYLMILPSARKPPPYYLCLQRPHFHSHAYP